MLRHYFRKANKNVISELSQALKLAEASVPANDHESSAIEGIPPVQEDPGAHYSPKDAAAVPSVQEDPGTRYSLKDASGGPAMQVDPGIRYSRREVSRLITQREEGFSESLIRIIDKTGLTDPEVYKKAHISRQLFNHIKNDPTYHPNRSTAISLLCALELPLGEFQRILSLAGYTLSNSSKADVIIRYCIENEIYSILDINDYLYYFGQPLLGSPKM